MPEEQLLGVQGLAPAFGKNSGVARRWQVLLLIYSSECHNTPAFAAEAMARQAGHPHPVFVLVLWLRWGDEAGEAAVDDGVGGRDGFHAGRRAGGHVGPVWPG